MSAPPPFDPTVDFYDAHAGAFAADTLGVDMGPLYEPFLVLVRSGGHILDAGCGPGRDARAFHDMGYRVTAFDASTEMARLAAEHLGEPVQVLRLQDLAAEDEFDGVWACASLLHVPAAEMTGVLARLARALRPGGALFVSFKLGAGEETRGGRQFTHQTEESLQSLLDGQPDLTTVRVWRTSDRRPNRDREEWVNALAIRGHTEPEQER
jgi:SAM-dependent methyltransferase